ncbi:MULTISPECIES: class I SAM-dependent methyltransferase [Arthrobacter]|uniref:Class I SAM-dependent methyltransferase n=2 Tax=Arthrobacter TaxID=1663 RepID=A0ABU9KP97_9MICC|nr:class I SAM-dependent methyltransferase [Arthrobacter sp. YJM1]MDP5228741.1 class I SAM-dependent methyltransferase [Arthrobacter sp. YJM1]
MPAAVSQIAPLLTPEAFALLNALEPYSEQDSLAMNLRLRKDGHAPELVSALLTQSRLRAKATAKFGEFAQDMLFTQAGLEQATRLSVAALHAERYLRAGVSRVIDLGCGLGADSLAIASLGVSVTAVERDEETAACAAVNLRPFPEAEVVQADATTLDLAPFDGVWLDPARREVSSSGSARLWDPEAFSPPLSFVEGLAAQSKAVGVKFGPGMPHESIPGGCEAQWVSVDGDVTEVALWFNALARPGVRRAALVTGATGSAELTSAAGFGESPEAQSGPVEGYLHEPDGAVIRAGLVSDLAERIGAHFLDPHIAYLCSPDPVDSPFARSYRILQTMPYNVKALRAWAKAQELGSVEIKKRGTAVTPEELRRRILPGKARKGGAHATLVLTRIGDDRVVLVVEPLGRG